MILVGVEVGGSKYSPLNRLLRTADPGTVGSYLSMLGDCYLDTGATEQG